jgi:hypothetical protein
VAALDLADAPGHEERPVSYPAPIPAWMFSAASCGLISAA